jgi:hypothetical protein
MLSLTVRPHRLESRMREIRPSGSEGGVAIDPPSLPLSTHTNNLGMHGTPGGKIGVTGK